MLNHIRNSQITFPKWPHCFSSLQQYMKVLMYSQSHQHWLLSEILILTILVDVKWCLIVLWFAFLWWLMMSKHLFSCAWTSAYLLWRNTYSNPLPMFLLGCWPFCYWVVWVLYSLGTDFLVVMWICSCFLPFCRFSLSCSCPLKHVSPCVPVLCFLCFIIISWNPLPNLMSWRFTLRFLS